MIHKMRIAVLTLLGLFIPAVAQACPACVDSGLFYFYPFLNNWFLLIIFWLLSALIFNLTGKMMRLSFPVAYFKWPKLTFVYWLILFFLSSGAKVGGGFFGLLIFIILPSWLILYIVCFVKARKLRSEHFLYRKFIVFQGSILVVFFLIIPFSYLVPRRVPSNVRMNAGITDEGNALRETPGGFRVMNEMRQ